MFEYMNRIETEKRQQANLKKLDNIKLTYVRMP